MSMHAKAEDAFCGITPLRPARGGSTLDTRRRALTIVEFGVVAAAVTVLVAIVEPSLEAARGKSKDSACLDRLREIGAATANYSTADPDGHALPIHPAQFMQSTETVAFIGPYEWGGKSGVGRDGFVPAYAGTPLGSKYGTAAGFGPARRPLNGFLYPKGFEDHGSLVFPNDGQIDEAGASADTQLRLDKFRCPADDGPPRAAHCPEWVNEPGQSSFDHFGTSYAANVFMIKAFGDSPMMSNSPYLRPLAGVPNPARTLAYEENIGRWAWAARRDQYECEWIGMGVDPGPTKAIRGWHGKNWTYHRAFMDTHVERQKIYVDGTEDRDGYAQHYWAEELPEYPPFPDCTQCAPMDANCPGGPGSFDYYRCIIVRGSGWQKDTLPAPFICTGVGTSSELGRASYEDCVQPAP
jgi:hypothetical protein